MKWAVMLSHRNKLLSSCLEAWIECHIPMAANMTWKWEVQALLTGNIFMSGAMSCNGAKNEAWLRSAGLRAHLPRGQGREAKRWKAWGLYLKDVLATAIAAYLAYEAFIKACWRIFEIDMFSKWSDGEISYFDLRISYASRNNRLKKLGIEMP